MVKSATDVMHEIILSAVRDGIDALKSASKGMPNTLVRDMNAIHPNAAFADLPPELRAAIASSVRNAFNRLLKEGYTVSETKGVPSTGPGRAHTPGPPRRPSLGGKPRPKSPNPRGRGGR